MSSTDVPSPITLHEISGKYAEAFDIIWRNEFEGKQPFHHDTGLIFWPLSQLIGHSFETAIKGLLICRSGKAKKTHELITLFGELKDPALRSVLDDAFKNLDVPKHRIKSNSHIPSAEVIDQFRTFEHQLGLLNENYSGDFATRYPQNGGHRIPNLPELRDALAVVLDKLEPETRQWGLSQPDD